MVRLFTAHAQSKTRPITGKELLAASSEEGTRARLQRPRGESPAPVLSAMAFLPPDEVPDAFQKLTESLTALVPATIPQRYADNVNRKKWALVNVLKYKHFQDTRSTTPALT